MYVGAWAWARSFAIFTVANFSASMDLTLPSVRTKTMWRRRRKNQITHTHTHSRTEIKLDQFAYAYGELTDYIPQTALKFLLKIISSSSLSNRYTQNMLNSMNKLSEMAVSEIGNLFCAEYSVYL